MIFSALTKLFKTLIDGFANLCAFVLVRLRLWIAAVYSFLYIIICAVAGIELAGKTVQIFFVGLFLSIAAGIIWTVLAHIKSGNYSRNNTSREHPSDIQKVTWRDERYKAFYSGRDENNFLPNGENKIKDIPEDENIALKTSEPKSAELPRQRSYKYTSYNQSEKLYDDFSDLKEKYLAEKESERNSGFSHTQDRLSYTQDRTYERDRAMQNNSSSQRQSQLPQQSQQSQEKLTRLLEQEPRQAPMIFSMRRDPNVLIYEYSDRLEFCRKTKEGLLLEKIEYKN